ncbi:MAG: hypothetical protein ABI167_09030 [Nitrosospira sp.]
MKFLHKSVNGTLLTWAELGHWDCRANCGAWESGGVKPTQI